LTAFGAMFRVLTEFLGRLSAAYEEPPSAMSNASEEMTFA